MKLAAFALGCLISAPLCALEPEGRVITLTGADMEKCKAGGGCVLVTNQEVFEIVSKYVEEAYADGMATGYEEGAKDGAKSCPGRNRT